MLPLIVTAAIIVEDQTVLRAAPEENAPRPAVLWKGDWVEVRGQVHGFLSVYDHRRERAGYVDPSRVRAWPVDPSAAAPLRAVIGFVRDAVGSESLGIGLAALYLRAAPREEIDATVFDAIGSMAARLADRVSTGHAGPRALSDAEHLAVASAYGVRFEVKESLRRALVCYDGEAFRQLLALGGTQEERLRAALFLTDRRCMHSASGSIESMALETRRERVLDEVDASALEPRLKNRIHLRRAEVWASIVRHHARAKDLPSAATAFDRALTELARVDRTDLFGEDLRDYDDAALRIATVRWAAEAQPPFPPGVSVVSNADGQTCLHIERPVFERCTYGILWNSSLRSAPRGHRMALAVEPMPGWVELWLLSRTNDGWHSEVLIPATVDPELGYVELAGWLPDGARALVAREVKTASGTRREFSVVDADTAAIETSASSPNRLGLFRKHQSPEWVSATLALR